jgi:hypothetical protein
MDRQTRISTAVVSLVLLAPFLVFLPQVPGYVTAALPKEGRVIDAQTHEPVADATVIAAAIYSSGTLLGGSDWEKLYSLTTATDRDGWFAFPSEWGAMKFGFPGLHPRTVWVITVFKPPFAVVGDEDSWAFDVRGRANSPPRSTELTPSWTWVGDRLRVGSIEVSRPSFELNEAAVYYRKIAALGLGTVGTRDVQSETLRRIGRDALKPWVCRVPPDTVVNAQAVEGVIAFSEDASNSYAVLEATFPDPTYLRYHYLSAKFAAADVCEAMKLSD